MAIALAVIIFLLGVHAAVDLDDQASSVAVEIDDEPVDDLLPSNVQPGQPVPAYPRPDEPLAQRHLAPELLRALGVRRVDGLALDDGGKT